MSPVPYGIENSSPTVESKHRNEPRPLGWRVPGLMKTLVRSIEGISTWQYFVNNDDMPGTTEHPTNAVMPAASASEDS